MVFFWRRLNGIVVEEVECLYIDVMPSGMDVSLHLGQLDLREGRLKTIVGKNSIFKFRNFFS